MAKWRKKMENNLTTMEPAKAKAKPDAKHPETLAKPAAVVAPVALPKAAVTLAMKLAQADGAYDAHTTSAVRSKEEAGKLAKELAEKLATYSGLTLDTKQGWQTALVAIFVKEGRTRSSASGRASMLIKVALFMRANPLAKGTPRRTVDSLPTLLGIKPRQGKDGKVKPVTFNDIEKRIDAKTLAIKDEKTAVKAERPKGVVDSLKDCTSATKEIVKLVAKEQSNQDVQAIIELSNRLTIAQLQTVIATLAEKMNYRKNNPAAAVK